jgi:transcriptional regulator NrdR family protein
MVQRLSILKVEQEEDINFQTNQQDVWTTAIKVISNFVPFGSPVGELTTSFIPNQKIERVVRFTEKLNEKLIDYNSKLDSAEKRISIIELKNPEFADLFEEAANQASRALTDERLEYIASLLKNSLTENELNHIEKKKLLLILSELNDAEIIWLKHSSLRTRNGIFYGREKFYENHKTTLKPISVRMSNTRQEQMNKFAIQKSYIQNLVRLNLAEEDFDSNISEFDKKVGNVKVNDIYGTALGNLLLKYIDVDKIE